MDPSPDSVLEAVCEAAESDGTPVSVQRISTAVDTTPNRVRPVLESLRRAEFLRRTADGYRPTVTAMEFLELNVELTDVAVLEFVED